jgi:hypothetical protein
MSRSRDVNAPAGALFSRVERAYGGVNATYWRDCDMSAIVAILLQHLVRKSLE